MLGPSLLLQKRRQIRWNANRLSIGQLWDFWARKQKTTQIVQWFYDTNKLIEPKKKQKMIGESKQQQWRESRDRSERKKEILAQTWFSQLTNRTIFTRTANTCANIIKYYSQLCTADAFVRSLFLCHVLSLSLFRTQTQCLFQQLNRVDIESKSRIVLPYSPIVHLIAMCHLLR